MLLLPEQDQMLSAMAPSFFVFFHPALSTFNACVPKRNAKFDVSVCYLSKIVVFVCYCDLDVDKITFFFGNLTHN